MAKNSFSAFQKIKNVFLRIKLVFDVIIPLFPIAFLIYSLAVSMGFLWANIITLTLSAAHYIFHVIVLFQSREDKELKQTIKLIYKTCVRFVKFLTLAISIYGLWLSIAHINLLTLLLTALSLSGWIFQVTLDIIIHVVTSYAKFIEEAFLVNAEKAKKPAELPKPHVEKKRVNEEEQQTITPECEQPDKPTEEVQKKTEPKTEQAKPSEPIPTEPSMPTFTPNETVPTPKALAVEAVSAPSDTENNHTKDEKKGLSLFRIFDIFKTK